jgi:CDP-diacylglycerol--glycerol-3-phosphate 3-phosphatidyltransferase
VSHLGVDPRRSSFSVRAWLRLAYLVGLALSRIGLSPTTVTMTGLLASLGVPLVVEFFDGQWLFGAAGLVLVAALADSADGAVALMTSRATQLGSYYDSVADRIGEAAWLVALWLLGAPGVLVTACGALAWLHEYARARATASGMKGIGTITVSERPTRVILVVIAFLLAGLASLVNPYLIPAIATLIVAVWTLLGIVGGARLSSAIRAALR